MIENACRNATMTTRKFPILRSLVTDPECIALESLAERTRRFVFDESMLRRLEARGLVESEGARWQVTPRGREAMVARFA